MINQTQPLKLYPLTEENLKKFEILTKKISGPVDIGLEGFAKPGKSLPTIGVKTLKEDIKEVKV